MCIFTLESRLVVMTVAHMWHACAALKDVVGLASPFTRYGWGTQEGGTFCLRRGRRWRSMDEDSEDGAVIRCRTTFPIGVTWRWLHSPTNPKFLQSGIWFWYFPEGSVVKSKALSLTRVACNGKWALVCGWSAVSGDFRSQMGGGLASLWLHNHLETNTEQVWMKVIHPNQLPGWRPDSSICTYICPPPPQKTDTMITWNAFSS